MRDKPKVREEVCKQRAARRYNSKTKSRSFQEGDLVWRMRGESRKPTTEGKFSSNWEGPFKIKENLSNGAYVTTPGWSRSSKNVECKSSQNVF